MAVGRREPAERIFDRETVSTRTDPVKDDPDRLQGDREGIFDDGDRFFDRAVVVAVDTKGGDPIGDNAADPHFVLVGATADGEYGEALDEGFWAVMLDYLVIDLHLQLRAHSLEVV